MHTNLQRLVLVLHTRARAVLNLIDVVRKLEARVWSRKRLALNQRQLGGNDLRYDIINKDAECFQ
jgi:hypothetical protein